MNRIRDKEMEVVLYSRTDHPSVLQDNIYLLCFFYFIILPLQLTLMLNLSFGSTLDVQKVDKPSDQMAWLPYITGHLLMIC